MNELESRICKLTSATSCELGPIIQELWSGYGVIVKATIDGMPIVVKHIDVTTVRANRRGWQSDFAHHRKVKSYQVETNFYREARFQCSDQCRVAKFLNADVDGNGQNALLILEDLDTAGYPARHQELDDSQLEACIAWLANFHSLFLGTSAQGLWDIGTYWHLDTRPDEYQSMPASPLKSIAPQINERLNSAVHKTIVHGDAKVANFCFADESSKRSCGKSQVAAVDFQYAGGGVGVKDLAYLISSCLSENEAEEREDELLNLYFRELSWALTHHHPEVNADAVEQEWRSLYPFAWADFCRFLEGWSPGHWKLNRYSKKITDRVIDELA